MRAFILLIISFILLSCHQETEQERISRELNESMQKLNQKIEEGNKIVDEKTKEALDKFEKEIGIDSAGKIKFNKKEASYGQ